MAIHAPITGAQTRAPFIPVPPAAISRVLSQFDRGQLAGFIAVAIDLLDLADGDADVELNGDEDDDDGDGRDAAYTEWDQRRLKVTAGGYEGPGMTTGTEDDEDDGDAEDHNGCEDDFIHHGWNGPGCPIADTGVFGEVAHHDDRPIADPIACREHRDFIRSTRCERIVSRYQYRGMPIVEWKLSE